MKDKTELQSNCNAHLFSISSFLWKNVSFLTCTMHLFKWRNNKIVSIINPFVYKSFANCVSESVNKIILFINW